MAARIALIALGLLFVLALVLNKPAIIGLPLALVVPAGLAYAGYRSFGWKGAAFNLAGFVLISLIMYLIGAQPEPDEFYPAPRGG